MDPEEIDATDHARVIVVAFCRSMADKLIEMDELGGELERIYSGVLIGVELGLRIGRRRPELAEAMYERVSQQAAQGGQAWLRNKLVAIFESVVAEMPERP